jgi:hypothetical protein
MICVLLEKVQRMLVNWAARYESSMCANRDTGARACLVQFLPHESIGNASVCIVIMGQNESMYWLPQACFLVKCPLGHHFASGTQVVLGPCQKTWRATRTCTSPQVCHYCAHNMTIDLGLMLRDVNLEVPKSSGSVSVRWAPLGGFQKGCCTHKL